MNNRLAVDLALSMLTERRQCFLGGCNKTAVGAQYSHIQLWNPDQSGVLLVCHYAQAQIATAGNNVSIRHNAVALASAGEQGNKYLGGAAPNGLVLMESNGVLQGTSMGQKTLITNHQQGDFVHRYPIVIPQNKGLVLACTTADIAFRAYFEWVEIEA